jgi:sRNA-binding regulator protein Hfq
LWRKRPGTRLPGMHEPEESDESTSPAMRRVFDELEAEFEAGLRREAEQESMAAVRAEVGATVLWEQLARRIGTEVAVSAGARAFRGSAVASYPEFLVLRAADGTEHLIRYGPAVSVALPAEPPTLRPAPAPAARRYQFALALRELARRREPVRVQLLNGATCDGTIESVGSDYLEVAEHDLGEARRRAAVRARRFVGFAAVVAVTLPPGHR